MRGGKTTTKQTQPRSKNDNQQGFPKEFRDQFLKKIQFCSNQYDFNDENKHVKEK